MNKNKTIRLFLILGVILFSFVGVVGCSNNEKNNSNIDDDYSNEIIDLNDIEKITISTNFNSSINIYIYNEEDISTVVNILNDDKNQTSKKVEYSFNDVQYFIDIIYNDRVVNIKILSEANLSSMNRIYIIDNCPYLCSNSNYALLSNFIYKKMNEERPQLEQNYFAK